MPKVWIQLYIGRESDGFFSVTGLYSNVEELKDAVKQKCQPELDYCAPHKLEIYENGTTFDDSGNPNQPSLRPGVEFPPAATENNALIVVAPPKHVWIQLYIGRVATDEPIGVTGVYYNLQELKDAIKQKCQRKLDHCDAGDLKIYPLGTTFNDSGNPNQRSLRPGASVPPTASENNALIVVAPTKQQQRLQTVDENAIEPSVWHALGPFLCDIEVPSLAVMKEKVNKQGTKRKVFELDMETKTASRDGKKRRIWEARHEPVAVRASGTRWYQGMTEKAELFTRECTTDCFDIMWNTFEEEKQTWFEEEIERCIAFIVTGPPGLGKSWSSNTIVWHLLKKRQNIWFHSASDHTLTTFVFKDGENHPIISDRPENDVIVRKCPKGTWFLYDSVGGSTHTGGVMFPFQKQNVAVPCVIFSSPKDSNYKQGIKDMLGGLVWHLWMPSWEWNELEAVMPSFHKEFGGGSKPKEFKEFIHNLYEVWGGIPRRFAIYCQPFRKHGPEAALQVSEDDFTSELKALAKDLILNGNSMIRPDMLDNVGARGERESSSRKPVPASWLVFPFPIESEKGPYRSQIYRFCSRRAELEFLDCLESEETDAVRRFCKGVFQFSGTAGIVFERFAHFVLTRTESNTFRWKQYIRKRDSQTDWLPVKLPKCENREFEMKNDLHSFQAEIENCISADKCVVIDPSSDQQDAIDMFVVFKLENAGWYVLAMQDTISKTHSFHPVKILEYRKAAEKAFKAAKEEVRDDFFLHVVVVPKEDDSNPFRLQRATMAELAKVGDVKAKFEAIGLKAPNELDEWTVKKAKQALMSVKLKNKSKLTAKQAKTAGAEALLLTAAEDKVKGFTWILDGFF